MGDKSWYDRLLEGEEFSMPHLNNLSDTELLAFEKETGNAMSETAVAYGEPDNGPFMEIVYNAWNAQDLIRLRVLEGKWTLGADAVPWNAAPIFPNLDVWPNCLPGPWLGTREPVAP